MSRLSEDRRDELFRGVLDLVAEKGYDKVTMDQVAERTHSSKATLYRQWGSKARLVVDALAGCAGGDQEMPDTGSLRSDVHAAVLHRPRPEDSGISGDLLAALLPAVKTDADLAEVVRTEIIEALVRDIGTLAARAAARGEIDDDPSRVEHAALAFMAPFLLHHALHGAEPEDERLLAYVDAVVLPALGLH